MYTVGVKRLQIYIEEELDEALARAAVQQRTSKAALIRAFVAERIHLSSQTRDPLDDLVGRYEDAPADVDTVVYGP